MDSLFGSLRELRISLQQHQQRKWKLEKGSACRISHCIFMTDPRPMLKNVVKLRIIPTFLIENQITRQNKRSNPTSSRVPFRRMNRHKRQALYSITHVPRAHTDDGDLHVCFQDPSRFLTVSQALLLFLSYL